MKNTGTTSSPEEPVATIHDIALGAFLHDIGKLYQRIKRDITALPQDTQDLRHEVLPTDGFKHVLFSIDFLNQLEASGTRMPTAIDRELVGQLVAYHHRPRKSPVPSLTRIIARADTLSAGMDRKTKDRSIERIDAHWNERRFVPLAWLPGRVDIRQGDLPAGHAIQAGDLTPEHLLQARLRNDIEPPAVEAGYRALGAGFLRGFAQVARSHHNEPDLFHEGLIGLSEELLWCVPSSTMHEPDVPLHDHSYTTAAFASCLYAFQKSYGRRGRPQFHLLRCDLVGIQKALFRLASQQVAGVNRILRARSFLMQAIVDAAALRVRRDFGLPPYVTLMRAGGKFLMLLPALDDAKQRVEAIRAESDRWLAAMYMGDLALAFGLTEPLPGAAFGKTRITATLDLARQAAEAARQQVLGKVLLTPVLKVEFSPGPDGACSACGVRPAYLPVAPSTADEGQPRRCIACHTEHEIGRRLPDAQAIVWRQATGADRWAPFGLALEIGTGRWPLTTPTAQVLSGYRPQTSTAAWPFARRNIANFVPRMPAELTQGQRFESIGDEDGPVREGGLLTMAHLGALALDAETGRGMPMLALLKADVDRLGQAFMFGLSGEASPGRLVTLSRLIDAFFTCWLPWHLAEEYPHTYTVYAGGDDLLLIGPWHQMLALAASIRAAFRKFTGDNPNLTLSAGIELVGVREPLNRTLERAEARLEAAKDTGDGQPRDRICLIDEPPFAPLRWDDSCEGLPWLFDKSTWLGRLLDEDRVSSGWVHRLLSFLDQRAKAGGVNGTPSPPIGGPTIPTMCIGRSATTASCATPSTH